MTLINLPKLNQTGLNEWADVEDNDKAIRDVVNGNLDNSNIATGAAIAPSKLALTNAIATAHIQDLAVTTAKIPDSAITTAKIAADAVTADKIAAPTIVSGSGTGTPGFVGTYQNLGSVTVTADGLWLATATAVVTDGAGTSGRVTCGARLLKSLTVQQTQSDTSYMSTTAGKTASFNFSFPMNCVTGDVIALQGLISGGSGSADWWLSAMRVS